MAVRHSGSPLDTAELPRHARGMLTAILLSIIGALLILNGWQCYVHERAMRRLIWGFQPAQPTPLVVPRNAGWGTMMDLAKTQEFRYNARYDSHP
jgi:hypothetical protein